MSVSERTNVGVERGCWMHGLQVMHLESSSSQTLAALLRYSFNDVPCSQPTGLEFLWS